MKKVQFLLSAGLSLLLASCCTSFKIVSADVPQAVQSAFTAKYAAAQNIIWEVEKENGQLVFEAMFKMDGKKKEAEFKPDGTFVKEE
jgi:hypothetical protein